MGNNIENVHSELSRDLNLFHVVMMGLGMMIGAGVFLGIGSCIEIVGPGGLLLTFAINGMIALFTAMSYAELSSAIPRAGGAYNFARISYGRRVSFVAGWMEWFASSVAGSMYAATFALYTMKFILVTCFGLNLPPLATDIINRGVAVMAALLFIYINYRGTSETGKIGALVTLGQTTFMLLIGIGGLFVVLFHPERMANFADFMPKGWLKLPVAMGAIYVAFEGYEVIAQAGDEVKNPKINLPKAMLYSVLVVTFTYVLVAFSSIIAVNANAPDLNGQPAWAWIGSYGAEGFQAAVGRMMPFANLLLTLAVIFSSTSALNATIYSGTRASYALGRDGMLPKFFESISKRNTPFGALIVTGGIVITMAALLPVMKVAASASLLFLILFFMVNLCVIKVRRTMSDELTYGYLMPLFPFIPIFAIICQVILVMFMHEFSMMAVALGAAIVIMGFLMFQFYGKAHAKSTPDEILVFEEETEHEVSEGNKVMMAVANPANALAMVKNTYRLCERQDASVELIHMVPVPEAVTLSDSEPYKLEGKEGIIETILYLSGRFKVNTTLRYCRNIARGIVSAVREKRIDMLVMGWHGGRSKTSHFALGSTIDPIIERAACDVVIMKNCDSRPCKKILIPVAGGPNSSLALRVADMVADKDVELTVFSVVTRRMNFDPSAIISKELDNIKTPTEQITHKSVVSENVEEAILKEAENYDMMVIGATRSSHIFQASLPESIASKCDKPIIMVSARRRKIFGKRR